MPEARISENQKFRYARFEADTLSVIQLSSEYITAPTELQKPTSTSDIATRNTLAIGPLHSSIREPGYLSLPGELGIGIRS